MSESPKIDSNYSILCINSNLWHDYEMGIPPYHNLRAKEQIKVENPGFLYPNILKVYFLTVWDRHHI